MVFNSLSGSTQAHECTNLRACVATITPLARVGAASSQELVELRIICACRCKPLHIRRLYEAG